MIWTCLILLLVLIIIIVILNNGNKQSPEPLSINGNFDMQPPIQEESNNIQLPMTFGKYINKNIADIYTGNLAHLESLIIPYLFEIIRVRNKLTAGLTDSEFLKIEKDKIIFNCSGNETLLTGLLKSTQDILSANYFAVTLDRALIAKNGSDTTPKSYLELLDAQGDPYYIQWLLQEGIIRLTPSDLKQLESLDVVRLVAFENEKTKHNIISYKPEYLLQKFRFQRDYTLILDEFYNEGS